MSDKLKELRDKNPVADFMAGFIPGIGEAQDIHDFSIAARNKDFGGMALASLGFLVPFVNGNIMRKGVQLIGGRKFAKATDAPVYTKETAPKSLKLTKRDVTEMHLNDNSENAVQLFDRKLIGELNKQFANADHGTAIRIGNSLKEAGLGLSGKSAPLMYSMTTRWARQGKGGFFIPEGEPAMVPLNKIAQTVPTPDGKVMPPFDQKFVDDLNKKIREINELGYNFPEAKLEVLPNPFNPTSKLYNTYKPKLGKVLVPNIGFIKYKYGGKATNRFRIV